MESQADEALILLLPTDVIQHVGWLMGDPAKESKPTDTAYYHTPYSVALAHTCKKIKTLFAPFVRFFFLVLLYLIALPSSAPLTSQLSGVFKEYFSECAENGELELLKWGAENGAPLESDLWWVASNHGHVEILEWLYDAGVDWPRYACLLPLPASALNFRLSTYFFSSLNFSRYSLEGAATAGHRSVCYWTKEKGFTHFYTRVRNGALKGGFMDLVDWAETFSDDPSYGCTSFVPSFFIHASSFSLLDSSRYPPHLTLP
jgi:hypothetical protein